MKGQGWMLRSKERAVLGEKGTAGMERVQRRLSSTIPWPDQTPGKCWEYHSSVWWQLAFIQEKRYILWICHDCYLFIPTCSMPSKDCQPMENMEIMKMTGLRCWERFSLSRVRLTLTGKTMISVSLLRNMRLFRTKSSSSMRYYVRINCSFKTQLLDVRAKILPRSYLCLQQDQEHWHSCWPIRWSGEHEPLQPDVIQEMEAASHISYVPGAIQIYLWSQPGIECSLLLWKKIVIRDY